MRMYPTEIRLAVAEKLPVCFVLMADGLFGSVASASKNGHESRLAVSIQGSTWWRAIDALDCRACTVSSAEEFETAIRSWDRSGPLFVEAQFDPEKYSRMTTDLR